MNGARYRSCHAHKIPVDSFYEIYHSSKNKSRFATMTAYFKILFHSVLILHFIKPLCYKKVVPFKYEKKLLFYVGFFVLLMTAFYFSFFRN